MIKVYVQFYGQLRELGKNNEVLIEIDENSNCRDLLNKIEKDFPKFQRFRKYVICAVNNEFIDESYILKEGDKIAILPPVSGGKN